MMRFVNVIVAAVLAMSAARVYAQQEPSETPEDDGPEGWWCSERVCFSDAETCASKAASLYSCEWEQRAACFFGWDRMEQTWGTWCYPAMTPCLLGRQVVRRLKADYLGVGACGVYGERAEIRFPKSPPRAKRGAGPKRATTSQVKSI